MLKALFNHRFVQFGMVGIAGLLVDLAVLYLLAPWLGWYLARAVSFLAAATCTWGLNRTFTFRPAPGSHARLSIGREYLTYITSMLGGAAINYTVYVLTLHWMPGAAAPTIGVALGSCIGLISNFTAARMLLSHRPTQERMLPLAQWPAASRGALVGVFTDIDDTLTTEGAITPDALAALAALKAAGLQVVAITGRPVGWSEPFAAIWPIDAIVAENGAVALMPPTHPGEAPSKRYLQDGSTRSANYARMQQVLARIEREIPGAHRATDSPGRETDIAIDHSEFQHLDDAQIAAVVALMRSEGMHATVSSIHINGWYGDHDKLVGARWITRLLWGRELDAEKDRWAYVGDSTNDQRMFEAFAHSIGVANIARFVPKLAHLPHYVTPGERGAGFAEVAAAILSAR
ncbi:HAD-IIB family hydrolase [Variovorax arabinosiphilus]|uniref:HAD-IIB family hydrolase n=1 Tax=Variovorax arabinosiphilus TaxID=3053498 RepID=UPI00336596D9